VGFFDGIFQYFVRFNRTVVVRKGSGGLGSCWEGGGCSLPSVDNHDFV